MQINGREIATEIYKNLLSRVGKLKKIGVTPHLTVIIVGQDEASVAYVNQKRKWGEFIEAKITVLKYPESITTEMLENKIKELNNDPANHAIIIQRPLPHHIDIKKLELLVDPQKDIDGFHPDSPYTLPLPLAVMKILKKIYRIKFEARSTKHEANSNNKNPNNQNVSDFDIRISDFISWLKNQKIIILGKGATGGGPILKYLNRLHIHPALIDSKTQNPEKLTQNADIIISAIGKSNVITPNKIKKSTILIGVGIFRDKDGKLQGDFEETDVAHIASYYTPTPGGVGPVNVAMLMENLITATEKQST